MNPLQPSRSFTAALVGMAALAIVVLAVWWGRSFGRSPAVPRDQLPEVTRSELVLKEGRFYRPEETGPFHGRLVEFYDDGTLLSRSVVSNGLLHGVSEGWHTNGLMQVREHFRDGVSHGLRTKWYPDGQLLSEAVIEEGRMHGTFRRWHENGTLAEEVLLAQDQPDGVSRAWYASGYLKALARFEKGTLAEQKFWAEGETQGEPRGPGL